VIALQAVFKGKKIKKLIIQNKYEELSLCLISVFDNKLTKI